MPRFIMRLLLVGGLLGLSPLAGNAQQLLWEQARPNTTMAEEGLGCLALAPNGRQFMATGAIRDPLPLGPNCTNQALRPIYQLRDLSGTLVTQRLGRIEGDGEQGLTAATGSGYWWTGIELLCRSPRPVQRGFVQRLSWQGDTLRAWPLAPAPPSHTGRVVLAQRNKIIVAGDAFTAGSVQVRAFSLTCSDTVGNILWRQVYTYPPISYDYCTGLASLPSGGYLLTGDAYNFDGTSTTYPAQLIETDSLGRQRRRVLIQPLGPNYQVVETNSGFNNVLVLPNYGGYILSGTADSAVAGVPSSPVRVGYLMRLDTALQVQWVYRHPPGFGGTGVRSQRAFKVRQLTNGSLAFLLQDIGPFSSDTHLVHVSLQGQRLGHYPLPSRAFYNLAPFDWLWLDDGTLLLCGKANANATNYPFRAYLARWDLRQTPLAARQPTSTNRVEALEAWPNPATDRVRVRVRVDRPASGLRLVVSAADGRQLRELTVPVSGVLDVSTADLPAGVYWIRLLNGNQAGAGCRIAVVR